MFILHFNISGAIMKYLLTRFNKVYKYEIESDKYYIYYCHHNSGYFKGSYITLFEATVAIFTNKFNKV